MSQMNLAAASSGTLRTSVLMTEMNGRLVPCSN